MPALADLLVSDDLATVSETLHWSCGPLMDALEVELDAALIGSPGAARDYVATYRDLARFVVRAAPIADDLARRVVLQAEAEAADAPTTRWPGIERRADAVALTLVSRIRHLIGAPSLPEPLAWDLRPGEIDARWPEGTERFRRQVFHSLAALEAEHPLERIRHLFGLSKPEVGQLFGVRRQAIDGWLATKVPADRQEKVAAVVALADLLERKLKADRIPGVARRAADAYGGRTMLEMIASDRHGELLDLVRTSFAWSRAA